MLTFLTFVSVRYALRHVLALLTKANGRTEAALLLARLRDASIPCARGGAEGPRGIPSSAREIYVEEADLPRAREIFAEDRGGFDEEELTRLSEEAGQRWMQSSSAAEQSGVDPDAGRGPRCRRDPDTANEHRLRRAIEGLPGIRRTRPTIHSGTSRRTERSRKRRSARGRGAAAPPPWRSARARSCYGGAYAPALAGASAPRGW
jgi:hypothetical protein